MRNKTFLAINLNDFHSNQKGKPETNAQIKFIGATTIDVARKYMQRLYPDTTWFVVPQSYCDKNIVYATKLKSKV